MHTGSSLNHPSTPVSVFDQNERVERRQAFVRQRVDQMAEARVWAQVKHVAAMELIASALFEQTAEPQVEG